MCKESSLSYLLWPLKCVWTHGRIRQLSSIYHWHFLQVQPSINIRLQRLVWNTMLYQEASLRGVCGLKPFKLGKSLPKFYLIKFQVDASWLARLHLMWRNPFDLEEGGFQRWNQIISNVLLECDKSCEEESEPAGWKTSEAWKCVGVDAALPLPLKKKRMMVNLRWVWGSLSLSYPHMWGKETDGENPCANSVPYAFL